MNWFVYIIRTRQNTLYTGITTDILQRFAAHEQGKQGAKYLRSKGPLQMVYCIEVGSHSLAAKAEYRIKKLSKAHKERIVACNLDRRALLIRLQLQDDLPP
ncbi:MAG: GIY-YIG nuclease family protein [Phormidesmis sp.]